MDLEENFRIGPLLGYKLINEYFRYSKFNLTRIGVGGGGGASSHREALLSPFRMLTNSD